MASNNVISFEHSAGQAHKRLHNRNVERIVSGIRERLGQTTLPHLMQDLFERLDDELYALSDRSASDEMQGRYFDAMRQLRKLRRSIEQGFYREVSGCFERFWADPRLPVAVSTAGGVDEGSMSLVDDDDLEENLAISAMVSKAENRFHQTLFAVNKRLAFVTGINDIDPPHSPVGPKVLAEAFAKSLSSWHGDTMVRLVVFKLFDRHVMAYVGGMYDEFNDLFVENNVLPKVSRKIRRSPVAPSVQRARDPQAERAPDSVGGLSLDDELLRELAKLVVARRQSSEDGAPTYWYDRGATTPHLPQVSTQELLSALGSIQQFSLNQAPVDIDGLREMQAELMNSLGRELDVGSLQQPIKRLADNDRNLIDVVGMLFDFILDDENLPEPMKALLGRLQIPFLKIGLQDRRFFNDRQHPARQLLNTLARVALAWTDDGDRSQNSTYGQIESAVMRVLTDFEHDITVIEEVNKGFQTYLEREQRNANVAEQRLAQAREGQENLQQAKQRVSLQIQEFIDECALPECHIPEVVDQLLNSGWKDVMLLVLLREGEQSEAWEHANKLARELIWSVQPKREVAERQRLLKAIPELLKNLREGLNSISFDQHRSAVMLKELQTCHIAALRGNPIAPSGSAARPVAKTERPVSGEADAVAQQPPQQDDEYLAMARRIPVGAWLEWTNDEGARVRGKLSWRSELSGNSVFVDRRGIKVAEMGLDDIANRLRCANARALENLESPLMDRALSAMMDALKRTAPENRAH